MTEETTQVKTPILIDNLATEARLDPWEVAEAIANTVNYAVGGKPNPVQLADGIRMPHTPSGRIGRIVLQRAWLDKLSLAQLAEFRQAAAPISREILTRAFEQVLELFGGTA